MSDEKPSKGMILAGGVRFYELQKKRGLKNINLTGFKPMPLDTRWVLLPAELRSHTLRARQKRLLLCSDCKPNFWELFVCHLCNTTIVGSPLMFIADHRGESSPELKNNWFRLQRECSVPVDKLWKDLFRTYWCTSWCTFLESWSTYLPRHLSTDFISYW